MLNILKKSSFIVVFFVLVAVFIYLNWWIIPPLVVDWIPGQGEKIHSVGWGAVYTLWPLTMAAFLVGGIAGAFLGRLFLSFDYDDNESTRNAENNFVQKRASLSEAELTTLGHTLKDTEIKLDMIKQAKRQPVITLENSPAKENKSAVPKDEKQKNNNTKSKKK